VKSGIQKESIMFRKLLVLFALILFFSALPVGQASAQGIAHLNLPPGIEAQAQPLIASMMERMQQSGMSSVQMEMMMTDMQKMADQLPPGIFLKLLQLMPQLEMNEMMAIHQEIRQEGLLQLPPGQILQFVKGFLQ
jgi:hypothetical protein